MLDISEENNVADENQEKLAELQSAFELMVMADELRTGIK